MRCRTVSVRKSFCESDPFLGNSVYLSDRVGGQGWALRSLCSLAKARRSATGCNAWSCSRECFPCCGKRASTLDSSPWLFCICFWPTNQILWTTPEELKGWYSSVNTVTFWKEILVLYLIDYSPIDGIISLSQSHSCISPSKYCQYSPTSFLNPSSSKASSCLLCPSPSLGSVDLGLDKVGKGWKACWFWS